MFISIKSRSQLKLGHIRPKARSSGQILEKKTCVHSGKYSLDLILIIYVKIVLEKRTDLKVGHVGSETRSLAYFLKVKIPEFCSLTSKLYVKGFQEL